MAKRFFWLKFQTDFFQEPAVKKMRRMAGGDTFTIIYLKLQLLSVPEGGFIMLSGVEDDYFEELSLMIDEEKDNIQITCMYLLKYKLLEIIDDKTLFLSEASNNIGTESESARRMRKLRAKQASHCDALPSQCDDREEKSIEKRRYREDIEQEKNDAISNEKKFIIDFVESAFNRLYGRNPNASFMGTLRKLADEGLDILAAKDAMSAASTRKPRNPEPYIIEILKNKINGALTRQNGLAEWEKEWVESVKRRREQCDLPSE